MTLDEFKQLMFFEILMSGEDVEKYNYAAVDDDGHVYVYIHLPDRIIENEYGTTKGVWSSKPRNFSIEHNKYPVPDPVPNDSLEFSYMSATSYYKSICELILSDNIDWKDTLIDLNTFC